jgi:hypothetical protein
LKITELPTIFDLAPNNFHREPISTKRTVSDNEMAPLYYPGNEHNFGTTHGMLPEYYIFNHNFRNTLTPKHGDRTNIRGSTWNLLLAILDNQPPPAVEDPWAWYRSGERDDDDDDIEEEDEFK